MDRTLWLGKIPIRNNVLIIYDYKTLELRYQLLYIACDASPSNQAFILHIYLQDPDV